MYTRIISGVVAVVIAVILLILHNTFVFNIAIAFLSVVAINELFIATKFDEYKLQAYICYGYAAISVLPSLFAFGKLNFINNTLCFGLFILAMCLSYLKEHKNFNFTGFFYMIGIATFIPYSFNTLLTMAKFGETGVFMLVTTLAGAWLADTGAYFAGTFFGKTPLCPEISPKKTVEGLIGGVISNGILLLIIGLVYDYALKGPALNYFVLILAGMGCAFIGLIGDLTASIIKRQSGIKDYGNIMPGHGGIMDRFDSVLLVAPFMFYLFSQGLIIK